VACRGRVRGRGSHEITAGASLPLMPVVPHRLCLELGSSISTSTSNRTCLPREKQPWRFNWCCWCAVRASASFRRQRCGGGGIGSAVVAWAAELTCTLKTKKTQSKPRKHTWKQKNLRLSHQTRISLVGALVLEGRAERS